MDDGQDIYSNAFELELNKLYNGDCVGISGLKYVFMVIECDELWNI